MNEAQRVPPERQEQLLAMGRRATAQLERLASRLSLLARLGCGTEPQQMRCDLTSALHGAIKDVTTTRPRRRVSIETDGIVETAPVLGDAAALRMAIGELVDNAVRFAHRTVTITLDVGTETTVRIANDGPPVPPTPDRTGLGIGLRLARQVTARHHGTLTHSGNDAVWFAITLPSA
jgi:signal transduction histidine kinase